MTPPTDIAPVIRALNGVRSAGQARAAAGAALKYAHGIYDTIDQITWFGDVRASAKRAMDAARTQLERMYEQLPTTGGEPAGPSWPGVRRAIEKVYVEGAGAEVAAGYEPRTSNWAILGDAIAEAPSVFAGAVGAVARGAGDVVGSAAGGLLVGLGWLGPVLMLIAAAVLVFRFGGLSMIKGLL